MAKKQKPQKKSGSKDIERLFKQLELDREEIRRQYQLMRTSQNPVQSVYQLRTWLSGSSEPLPREAQYA